MAILTVSTLLQIAVEGHAVSSSGINRKIVNVYQFYLDNPAMYILPDKAVFAAAFDAAFWSLVANQILAKWIGDQYLVWLQCFAGDTPTASGVPTSTASLTARLPLIDCLYVELTSGFRGRNFNGSKRYGPLRKIQVANDESTGAADPGWRTLASNHALPIPVNDGVNAGNMIPCIWSRTLALANPPPLPQTVADITGGRRDRTVCLWKHRRERTVR